MKNTLFESFPNLSTPELGDYVMMESCVDLEENQDTAGGSDSGGGERRYWRREKEERKRDFPPPLTVLAMTENQPPHMPFVFRRYYTDDGRLVIVEERVPHHDYFLVTRSNGRLRLELVEMDDVEEGEIDDVEKIEDEECCSVDIDDVDEGEFDDVEEREKEKWFGSRAMVMGGGKCYDYLRVRSSPCLFGMTVPTVRPVHI